MRDIFLIFLIFLCLGHIHLQIEDEFQIRITKILSKDIALNGYLFLETDGVLIHPTSFNQENIFDLSIVSDEDKNINSLLCFFYKFERYVGPAIIACEINSKVKSGKYHLKPLEEKMSFLFSEIYIVNILPFDFKESFNIIEGNEFYFTSLSPIQLSFSNKGEIKTIKFELLESVSEEIILYLEDIRIICRASGRKMRCPILANDLPQDNRFKSFNVYIEDSQGNKKKNYFVYPIDIILDYIPKKILTIKVTELLTSSLTDSDFLVFNTSDNILGNVIFSKQGFYLKVEKDDAFNDKRKLYCGFHKHPGETTKILCGKEDNLLIGTYYFDEYVSDGPLEDEDDRISSNYKVFVPNFKCNNKFLYNSRFTVDENIYDGQLREKIELEFNNKEEILNITLNHDNYEGKNRYVLGNSQLECYNIGKNTISCGIQGNSFESSGIYYIEKISFLEEKERLYMLPPIKVTINWDK